jgi:hypothetical protein
VNSFALAVGGHVAKELLPSLDRRDRPRRSPLPSRADLMGGGTQLIDGGPR